ncbi:aspartyl protease family protein [Psychroflexus sp. CAK8W]|uniref:Aspartyl protease family protein n=1 Tax=Psychroflexus longus TaxID=2873596 RepID=A0ABS7XII1_9FLAO|nr:aspartyl protease family protein [Psychroflexus longus]MBZ9778263.1 aspartyl protease family protein [Psychroflexus longus]
MNRLKYRAVIFLIFAVFNCIQIRSQDEFKFADQDKRAVTLKFKSLNNLIILPATLNGESINFLVDTGVNKTKVFAEVKDSTVLERAEFISLRSLGSSDPVKAYKTTDNTIDFGPIYGDNQEVYYIIDQRYDLASKLGINVQGIIGYDLLKHFIFRLNYNRNSLRIYQHDKFNRKLRRFEKLEFRTIRNKPHLQLPVKFLDGSNKELVFLLDTGSSDAFWIFENDEITAPKNSFEDYVGYGLELVVSGKRSKLKSVNIGNYDLEMPRVAYIDSTSAKLFTADRYKNGIIGSEILRRFVTFFDYNNRNVYIKSSASYNDNSNYDRSGLILLFVGEEIRSVKTPILVKIDEETNYSKTNTAKDFEIRLEISKILEVVKIRPNSPASEIDILEGDRILKLDGKNVNRMNLEEINNLLRSEEGKRIKIQLQRGKAILKRELFLRSQLN